MKRPTHPSPIQGDEAKLFVYRSLVLALISVCSPQELEQQFERERLSLEEHKTLLRQQLDELREELTSKLTAANEEVGDTL